MLEYTYPSYFSDNSNESSSNGQIPKYMRKYFWNRIGEKLISPFVRRPVKGPLLTVTNADFVQPITQRIPPATSLSPHLMRSLLFHGPSIYQMVPVNDQYYTCNQPTNPIKNDFGKERDEEESLTHNIYSKSDIAKRTRILNQGQCIHFKGDGTNHVLTFLSNLPLFHTTTETFCYFEVEIQSLPFGSVLSIGLATEGYPSCRLPGWSPWSIGLQTDDGRIYFDDGFKVGLCMDYVHKGLGPGDIVGCGYEPNSGSIFWTLKRADSGNVEKFMDAISGKYRSYHIAVGCYGKKGAKVSINFGTRDFYYREANKGLNTPLKTKTSSSTISSASKYEKFSLPHTSSPFRSLRRLSFVNPISRTNSIPQQHQQNSLLTLPRQKVRKSLFIKNNSRYNDHDEEDCLPPSFHESIHGNLITLPPSYV